MLKTIGKYFIVGCAAIVLGVVVGVSSGEAAPFEDVENASVQGNGGVIHNAYLNRFMTKEEENAYITFIEKAQAEENTTDVSPELQDAALRSVVKEPIEEKPFVNLETYFDRTIPTTPHNLETKGPYASGQLTASGWWFSKYRFYFTNYNVNTHFGVVAHLDSYYIYGESASKGQAYRDVVYPGVGTQYYSSTHNGVYLYSYLATYDPVSKTSYYIY